MLPPTHQPCSGMFSVPWSPGRTWPGHLLGFTCDCCDSHVGLLWSAQLHWSELRFALAKGSYSRQSPTFWGRCTSDCCSFRNAWMQRFLECHVNIVIYPLRTVQICATHRSPKGLTSTVKCSMNVAAQITDPFGMSIQFYRFLPKPPLQHWLLTAHSTRHTLILWPFV